ncbi:putative alcohol zinc-containing [Diaporthe ampelina]|uniref:Putative alcohol zinc-containing n=1 Tax=Diaporthe ampelina TaxID=1214573 RepID=A0A0G2I9U2_9PEZI|nr:putative alcohol zinc-containing [Diaporthe ampelina]
MRALRYYGIRDIRLDDIPEPDCRPGCVKLRPAYVGICGSDIHLYFDEAVAIKPDFVHPLAKEKMPIVFGHEFGGVVTEVGDGVTRARVGDLVAVRPSLYDGTCEACVAGHTNVCQCWGWLGIHASGGLAESAVVEDKTVFRLPQGTSAEVSALVEPLAVGWHATRLARDLAPTSTALIIGGGPIGCAVYLALRAQGLTRIVVSEVSEARRDMLAALGAEHVLSPADADVAATVRRLSGPGRGAHAAFDCAGLPVTLSTALDALRPRGTIVNVAIRAEPVPQVDLNLYVYKEATLVSSIAYQDKDWEEVIEALAHGKIKPEAMVTSKIELQDLVEKGIKVLAKPGQQHCKILISVQQ